jgi:acetyl esterase/lipase
MLNRSFLLPLIYLLSESQIRFDSSNIARFRKKIMEKSKIVTMFLKQAMIFVVGACMVTNCFSQNNEVIHLWPGKVPGEDSMKHPARLYHDTSRRVIRITDITDPIITVYTPHGKHKTGAGIIVCPGGGNKYLAINIEGEEVAKWLNQLGITAFVLQYRVPLKQTGALQDIQRAIRLIRSNAAKWKLEVNKIGVMGFSAGGNLSARAGTSFNKVTYTPIDAVDSLSCRPDFALLLYPGSMASGLDHKLIPELTVPKNTPPMFLFVANDDAVGVPLSFAYALHDAKVPMELHVVPKGGHGYGLRKGNSAAEAWPKLAEQWMKQLLLIK